MRTVAALVRVDPRTAQMCAARGVLERESSALALDRQAARRHAAARSRRTAACAPPRPRRRRSAREEGAASDRRSKGCDARFEDLEASRARPDEGRGRCSQELARLEARVRRARTRRRARARRPRAAPALPARPPRADARARRSSPGDRRRAPRRARARGERAREGRARTAGPPALAPPPSRAPRAHRVGARTKARARGRDRGDRQRLSCRRTRSTRSSRTLPEGQRRVLAVRGRRLAGRVRRRRRTQVKRGAGVRVASAPRADRCSPRTSRARGARQERARAQRRAPRRDVDRHRAAPAASGRAHARGPTQTTRKSNAFAGRTARAVDPPCAGRGSPTRCARRLKRQLDARIERDLARHRRRSATRRSRLLTTFVAETPRESREMPEALMRLGELQMGDRARGSSSSASRTWEKKPVDQRGPAPEPNYRPSRASSSAACSRTIRASAVRSRALRRRLPGDGAGQARRGDRALLRASSASTRSRASSPTRTWRGPSALFNGKYDYAAALAEYEEVIKFQSRRSLRPRALQERVVPLAPRPNSDEAAQALRQRLRGHRRRRASREHAAAKAARRAPERGARSTSSRSSPRTRRTPRRTSTAS